MIAHVYEALFTLFKKHIVETRVRRWESPSELLP